MMTVLINYGQYAGSTSQTRWQYLFTVIFMMNMTIAMSGGAAKALVITTTTTPTLSSIKK
jgi:hypothetical protein